MSDGSHQEGRSGPDREPDVAPSTQTRKARCVHFGHSNLFWSKFGPIYPFKDAPARCRHTSACGCEVRSDPASLPFFRPQPDREFDSYYCGCAGWD